MANPDSSFRNHFSRAVIWVVVVFLFGASPLLFLHFINLLSEEQVAEKEIEQLVEIRYVLFVCCASVGATMMNFFDSGLQTKSWLQYFSIYIAPFLMLAYVFSKYMLVYVQLADIHSFGPGVLSTRLTILFSVIYCLFARTAYLKWKAESKKVATIN